MKKLSMAVAISLVMFSACSEGKVEAGNVPEAAKSAFASKYPGATGVEWKTETSDGKKVWEAKFKQNG
ncbi:MAG: hypothetical protein ABIT96_06585, partial [Ferruginibacter sp.]